MSEDASRDYLLELTTQVDPALLFTVDDEEYKLLSIDHFSETEEAKVMGLFQRYSYLSEKFEAEADRGKAEKMALAMRKLRIELLTVITDMSDDIAGKLAMSGQIKLMNAMQDEMKEKGLLEDEEESKDKAGDEEL